MTISKVFRMLSPNSNALATLRAFAMPLAVVALAVSVASCESTSVTKRIDYKSESRAPALEIPPDLSTPQYDDRYNVSTASGLAAQGEPPEAPSRASRSIRRPTRASSAAAPSAGSW